MGVEETVEAAVAVSKLVWVGAVVVNKPVEEVVVNKLVVEVTVEEEVVNKPVVEARVEEVSKPGVVVAVERKPGVGVTVEVVVKTQEAAAAVVRVMVG